MSTVTSIAKETVLTKSIGRFVGATLAIAACLSVAGATPSLAQGYRAMSCGDLWYARNAIYADKGYCFKTARARAVFGRGCFPPYGRLTRSERRRIVAIERWEARRGCN